MFKVICSTVAGVALIMVLAVVNMFSRLRETHGDEINPERR